MAMPHPIDRPVAPAATAPAQDVAHQAFRILQFAFVVAPIVAGADKFLQLLVNWDQYLAPTIANLLPVTPHTFMMAVGVIEIVAGVVVAIIPRYGSLLVAAWLAGIIVNLLMIGDYYDIALRDFGLFLAALTLARLATVFPAGLPARRRV